MSDFNNEPPTIIEHTTVNPVVERTTVIERGSWYSEPWLAALLIGAIAIIGLISYWAIYNPNQPPVEVSNTTIERDAPHRAQTLAPPTVTTPVIVNPPASPAPTINVNPAPSSSNSNPPVSTTSGGSSTNGPSNGYPNGGSNNGDETGNNGNTGGGDNATTGG